MTHTKAWKKRQHSTLTSLVRLFADLKTNVGKKKCVCIRLCLVYSSYTREKEKRNMHTYARRPETKATRLPAKYWPRSTPFVSMFLVSNKLISIYVNGAIVWIIIKSNVENP